MNYICSNADNNPNCRRNYDTPTPDFFCIDCGYDGLLMEKETIETQSIDTIEEKELGLCVLLMDASGSMAQPAFHGNPTTRLRLIAINAARGIFDLKTMTNASQAYVCGIKFDHRVERMFFKSVSDIIQEFDEDEHKFQEYIYNELMMMQGATDINGALYAAHQFVDNFLNNKLADFKNYTPLTQVVFTHDSTSKVIPNTRVLIYTDGLQYAEGVRSELTNPFTKMETDILMGAFFGNFEDPGCRELREILSPCPNHGTEQFFLIDRPSKIAGLRKLFRMASGASGFCPLCIPKE